MDFFVDLKKAFNTINREILLEKKLNDMGLEVSQMIGYVTI